MLKDHDGQDAGGRLTRIEKLCADRGVQMTQLRRQILEIVARSRAPIGAYAVLDELAQQQGRPIAPPTVYRTLDFLVENGFVVKIESRNAFAICDAPGHAHHGVLMICTSCGQSDEVENHALDHMLLDMAAASGFRLRRQVVEVEGLCQACGEADGS